MGQPGRSRWLRTRMPRVVMGLMAAIVLGAGVGPVWQPAPAHAATIRELSWYLDAMHVEEAHRISTGEGVTVAVVDTGVDASHPDLKGHVLEGREMGRKRDVGAKAQTDEDGHGTGMASLIAGSGDGGENSLLGVAPDAKILPVRIAQNSKGAFRPEDVYEGVRWAIDQGAEVVNISLGGERSSDGVWKEQLVDYAIKHDVILVAAAGNTGQGDKQVAEPASIPGVVAVSGLTHDGTFWDGSAKGPEVVVSAPAEELPHAVPTSVSESGYALADGTSGATALVSGVSALIRDAFPDATINDVVNRLIRTAEDRGDGGRDDEYGFGAVDARAALEGEVPKVKHHPLLSPEAAASDEAAAAARARGGTNDSTVALIVVGVFIGSTVLLIVGWYLIFLARRSSQVVVAGVVPGHQATPVTNFSWGLAPPHAPVVDPRAGPMGYPPPAAWPGHGQPAAPPQGVPMHGYAGAPSHSGHPATGGPVHPTPAYPAGVSGHGAPGPAGVPGHLGAPGPVGVPGSAGYSASVRPPIPPPWHQPQPAPYQMPPPQPQPYQPPPGPPPGAQAGWPPVGPTVASTPGGWPSQEPELPRPERVGPGRSPGESGQRDPTDKERGATTQILPVVQPPSAETPQQGNPPESR